MAKEITTADLKAFKRELLHDLRNLYLEFVAPRPANEYLRPHDACRMFNISVSTLRMLRRQKELPFMKVSRVVYYHVDDIKRILDANKSLNLKKK